ncbi:MAG: peptidase MA family metallohydrolase [Candidatus Limnocylindria bacterium]
MGLMRMGAAMVAALVIGILAAAEVRAFDGFGAMTADSTYDVEIRFDVELNGEVPDRLELLVRTPGSESSFVTVVEPEGEGEGGAVSYVLDTSVDHLTPNTLVTYQWRATDGDDVVLGPEQTVRYEDDRDGLDWQRAQLGEATVHWYGDAEAQARRFGELTAVGVERAEDLLGTQLAGPVDVFVYDSREDFFGALGPGAREWTGAAAYSELRTIFMWLGGGSPAYLEVAMVHEVTHIVFFDATDNAFHEPARWLNEGIATWSEAEDAGGQRGIVEFEASGAGLFSFDAISEQFPIGERGGQLSYAQGTTMVDLIIDRYGREAIARMTAAYRDGGSDAEALEAATDLPADELYAAFFEEFGVDQPEPITPEPIGASNVDRPLAGEVDAGGVDPDSVDEEPPAPPDSVPGERPSAGADDIAMPLLGLLAGAGIAAIAAAIWLSRRAARSQA